MDLNPENASIITAELEAGNREADDLSRKVENLRNQDAEDQTRAYTKPEVAKEMLDLEGKIFNN